MYITEDVGDIYVDMSNSKRVRLNAEAAEKIRKITYNSDRSYKSEVSFNYDDIFALTEQVAELEARRPTYVLNIELIGETTEDGFDICRANPSEVVEAAAKHMDGYAVYCELNGLRMPLMAVEEDYLAFVIGSGIETVFVYISLDGYGAIENVFGVYDDEYRAFLEEYREQIETLQEADGALAEADAEIRSELENKAPHRAGVYFVKGTGTTAGTWLGTSNDITEYYDGLTVAYEIGVAGGSSTTTLNINGLGAKTCYRYGTTKITTQYTAGTVILLVYSATKGAWYSTDYDANTDTKVRLYKDETGTYPIIGSRTAASGVTSGTTAVYGEISESKAITMTPSTGTITATTFAGNASTATKATQDASGNVITDTYATKAELNNHTTTHAPSNAEKNQNAFSNIKVGDTTIAADTTTDTFTMVAGSNITLTPDATNDKVTITATDTTYGVVSTTADGLAPKRDGSTTKFLRGDGSWAVPTDNNTTYTFATGDNNGQIKVTPSSGSATNVSVKGLGSAAYATKGAANGVAELDANGKVPSSQLPTANGSAAGVTIVYPAASCTTFSSDSGTITPLAAQKAAKMFAITRPTSVANTIPRFTNTTGDVESTGIKIESVTNSKDSSKKAHVLSIPAEGGKKMVYGYCTDQVDGTSFIGGVFDANATSFPYAAGLAIGGTSGNLLWKGAKVVTTDDLSSYATTSSLSSYLHKTSTTAQTIASAVTFNSTAASSSKTTGAVIVKGGVGVSGSIYGNKVYGAVWNDYAEYREGTEEFEAGRVVCENGDDTLSLATERLQPGANIVSDTFGFAIGETDAAKTPLAVSGRVLAYTYEDRETYKPGDAVCAAPNGTVSKMTREEIREYPERIIGTVSAIPSYEVWGENNIPVNGRIWIKVK